MEINDNSKEKEVRIDIESGEASNGPRLESNWGKISLSNLFGRILGLNESNESEARANSEYHSESTELLVDKDTVREQSLVESGKENESENEKERQRSGKVKKAPKPPRPPKGPSLDAADMRLLKEISKVAIKKRERMERVKAFKKMKNVKASSASSSSLSSSSSSSSSSSLLSSGASISAMFATIFFFLVIIFQGIGSGTGSNLVPAWAPEPAPMTTGLTPVEFYKTIMSDDGAAPRFLPPRSPRSAGVKHAKV